MKKSEILTYVKAAGLCILLLFASCRSERKYVMPEKKFITFLVDMHLAEAIGSHGKRIDVNVYDIDSASLYGSVFQKYNISQVIFDSTMMYYSRRPEKFKKIIENVNGRLHSMEQQLAEEEKRMELANKDVLWENDSAYVFRQGGDKVEISIPLKGPGLYTVEATVKILADDAALDPRMSLYFWKNDSTEEGSRLRFTETRYTWRNGQEKTYRAERRLNNSEYSYLRGFLANYSNADSVFRRNMVIKDILVSRQIEPKK
jgi:hypothetical protein